MAGRIRASAAGLRRRVVGAREVQVDHGRGPGSSGEIVFCGPVPPAATGIATYDRAVLLGGTKGRTFELHVAGGKTFVRTAASTPVEL